MTKAREKTSTAITVVKEDTTNAQSSPERRFAHLVSTLAPFPAYPAITNASILRVNSNLVVGAQAWDRDKIALRLLAPGMLAVTEEAASVCPSKNFALTVGLIMNLVFTCAGGFRIGADRKTCVAL